MRAREKVTILGAGAWGTALGCAMTRGGHDVCIWGRNESVLEDIKIKQRNRLYLDNIALVEELRVCSNLSKVVDEAEIILLVTPAQSVAEMVAKLGKMPNAGKTVIACAKGIDQKSGKTPVELICEVIEPQYVGVLSGPSFAADVARGLPTAVALAFGDMAVAKRYAKLLSSENFRIYASDDIAGVELGGALKNVLALAVGAARGLQLGASAEAALIARGFGELRRLAGKMGARQETLSGLSGLGDLVLTASSTNSRNFTYGIALGRGDDLNGLALAEGAFSARIASKLAGENNVEVPIIDAVSAVLDNDLSAGDAVRQLLARPLKAENQ